MNGNVLLRFKRGDRFFVLTQYYVPNSERSYSVLSCNGESIAEFNEYETNDFIMIIRIRDLFGKELLDNLKYKLSKYA